MSEIIDAIKEKFQVWLLIQRDKYLRKELSKLPSDNQDDYYFDNLTNSFINKDYNLNVQIGWKNTLNVVKTKIESLNLQVESLQAIIDDIAQVNVDTTNLQAIISDISNINAEIQLVNINTTNLQAIITEIAQINIDTTNLQAIIANIASIDVDTSNLQAIIAYIANIETQNVSMNTAIANINTNIGIINTAITNIEAHQIDIDLNIDSVETLQNNIINQENKGSLHTGTIAHATTEIINLTTNNYLYNACTIYFYHAGAINLFKLFDIDVKIKTNDNSDFQYSNVIADYTVRGVRTFRFDASHYIRLEMINNGDLNNNYKVYYSVVFSYTEQPPPQNEHFVGWINQSSDITRIFRFTDKMINRIVVRLDIIDGTLNSDVEIEVRDTFFSRTEKILDLNITSGQSYLEQHSFEAVNEFKLFISNNDESNQMKYMVNLFFSSNLEPELDEHIDTSEIHDIKYTDALAVQAVENESTLDLKGIIQILNDTKATLKLESIADAVIELKADKNNDDEAKHAWMSFFQDGNARYLHIGVGKEANDNESFITTYAKLIFFTGALGSGVKRFEISSIGIFSTVPLNMGSKKITSLLDPTNNQDGATKKYVDDNVSKLHTGTYTGNGANNRQITGFGFEPKSIILMINIGANYLIYKNDSLGTWESGTISGTTDDNSIKFISDGIELNNSHVQDLHNVNTYVYYFTAHG